MHACMHTQMLTWVHSLGVKTWVGVEPTVSMARSQKSFLLGLSAFWVYVCNVPSNLWLSLVWNILIGASRQLGVVVKELEETEN